MTFRKTNLTGTSWQKVGARLLLSASVLLVGTGAVAQDSSGTNQKMHAEAAKHGVKLLEVVLDKKGQPLENATVRVCKEQSSDTPCSPMADLFQNEELTIPAGNPVMSDNSGKVAVYVAKGAYHLQISADGMKTIDLNHVEAGSESRAKEQNDESQVAGNLVILQSDGSNASFASAASQEPNKIAPDMSGYSIGSDGKVPVVVQFHSTPDSTRYAEMLGLGSDVIQHLDTIKAMALNVPVQALSDLLQRPDVAYVSPDRVNKPMWDDAPEPVNAGPARTSYGVDGTGIGIAVIDSGVYQHDDLQSKDMKTSRIVYSESFVPGDATTNDGYGHGTHVAGILAGNGHDSAGRFVGIAPNANIINLRVLDADGGGSDSAVIAAINRAIQLKTQYNIRVINLSLGRNVYESYKQDPLCQAVEQAWQAGIVVVVAAGNMGRDNSFGEQGYATIEAPGNDPNVITVGAMSPQGTWTRNDDIVSSYSSKGPTLLDHILKPDVMAPGNKITSLLAAGSTLSGLAPASAIIQPTQLQWLCDVFVGQSTCNATSVGPQYLQLSGTSMATPVVAAGAALMIQSNPNLTPDTIKARIMRTAWKGYPVRGNSWSRDVRGNQYLQQYDAFTIGAGYLDIQAAMADTTAVTGGAPSPTVVFDHTSHNATLVNGLSVVWGQTVVWGQSMVWGQSVVWGQMTVDASSVVWGNSVVWGQDGTDACSMVWGQSVVWGQLSDVLNALSSDDPGDPSTTDSTDSGGTITTDEAPTATTPTTTTGVTL